MQSRSSLRLVNWALFSVMAAALASACVISSGDGDDEDTDISDGGSDGSGATSGSGGSAGSGGSSGTGGSSGGSAGSGGTSASSGGTPSAGAGGEGTATGYVPGLCQPGNDPIRPTVKPACTATAEGTVDDCVKCMKANCCAAWQTCYGDAPATACGSGATESDPGQFLCIRECFEKGVANANDPDDLLRSCTDDCTGECSLVNDETSALIDCTYTDNCSDECFAF